MKCLNCGKEVKNKFCNVSCQNLYKGKCNKIKYETNPKYCANCGKTIDWEHRYSKFCCKKCSTSYNNKLRGSRTLETKLKISETLKNKYNDDIQKNKKIRICGVCGNEYYYNKGINTKKFCSKDCSEFYRKNKKSFLSEDAILKLSESGKKSVNIQGDNRRSKNEIYFYELCKNKFKNVVHNERIFNGWDADIILHDQKIAVLWNGSWHYKSIKSGTSLEQIQNRDNIKISEIIKCNYTPYVIKDMGKYNKKFVETEFLKFLENI